MILAFQVYSFLSQQLISNIYQLHNVKSVHKLIMANPSFFLPKKADGALTINNTTPFAYEVPF